MVTTHGTCVLVSGIGVLLRGPSGSGKSDVALRLIDGGALLVADDQVELRMVDGKLTATAPAAIAGLIEARGVGILTVPAAPDATVGLVVDLVAANAVERLPAMTTAAVLDIRVPRLALAAFDASTPAKVRLAAAAAANGRLGALPAAPSPVER